MIKKRVMIENRTGLHARPAAVFVEIADRYEAEVNLTFDGVTINAKSIIGVLSLGIGKGDEVTISVDGVDENEALEALIKVIENQFGETGV